MDVDKFSARNPWRFWQSGIVALFAVLVLALPLQSVRSQTCGSFDGTGPLHANDLADLVRYLFLGWAPPPSPATADCDGHQLLTLRDAQFIYWHIFQGGPALNCPTTTTTQPVLDSGFVVTVLGSAPANTSNATLYVWLSNDETVSSFCLPLQVQLDGQPVEITDIVESDVTNSWDLSSASIDRIDSDNDVALIAALNYFRATPEEFMTPGDHYLAAVTVSYLADTVDRDFSFVWQPITPIIPMSGYPDTSLIAMVVGLYLPTSPDKNGQLAEPLAMYEPILTAAPCLCGDADNNGIFTISDPVYLINYIFAAGPDPAMPCLGDADGNGILTISDCVYTINFIFAGGPPPHCP